MYNAYKFMKSEITFYK